MSDRFQALTVFRRVAQCGSFSKAGRELGLSQSSVSRIIADLERDLGTTLLLRTTRALKLTDAGADYLGRAEAILDALEEADFLARGEGTLTGRLRIGVSTTFGIREVVPRLPAFLSRHPDLYIDLSISDTHQDLVAEGIDIAFRLGQLADSSLIARRIASSPRILVASPDYIGKRQTIRTAADLTDHDFIVGPGILPAMLQFRDGDRQANVSVTGRVTCTSNEASTEAAKCGLGISVTSVWGVSRELQSGELVRILPEWTLPPIDLHAVFPPVRIVRPAARALTDYFAESMRPDASGIQT